MIQASLSTSYWAADTSEPVLETTVGGVLRDAAARSGNATALVEAIPDKSNRRRWTYAELLEESERAARALLGRFNPGERVAVWANNIPEWVVLEFGCALANLTLVTVNPAFKPRELRYVLGQSRAAGIFLVPEFRGNPMAASLEAVRTELPEVREVIPFADFKSFCASGSQSQRLPEAEPDDELD